MIVVSSEPTRESLTDQCPLLLERHNIHVNEEHVIDVERGGEASSSGSSDFELSQDVSPNQVDRAINSMHASLGGPSSSSSNRMNSANSSLYRRRERLDQRNWSPLNSGLWISIELLFTLGQIIASMIVLYFSRHEHPQAPLFAWVVGYTAGCFTSLPVLYWRFLHRNQDAVQASQASPHAGSILDHSSYVNLSSIQPSEQENHHSVSGATYEGQTMVIANTRSAMVMDHFKMALNCFFAVWFVLGNVWIFGGHASAAEAPNLYWLCMVYLTLSCIGYATPFILCAMVCCCLPCIISFLGIREDLNHVRGASEESINALPTYKFKLKKDKGGDTGNNDSEEGGILVKGTEECLISGEDAVCCICLTRYNDGDMLRGLPCSHFFHVECVDKWLKINSTCPLCKNDITETETDAASSSQTNSMQET